MTRDAQRWVVAFDAPTDPGVTYLYDRTTGKGTFLFRPRPWLKPTELADMKPVAFPARDGLTIHGYLTTPTGTPARKLPLVLLVHGGPWARDDWGYQPKRSSSPTAVTRYCRSTTGARPATASASTTPRSSSSPAPCTPT